MKSISKKLTINSSIRLEKAKISLQGLRIGDSIGNQFFKSEFRQNIEKMCENRIIPHSAFWQYTDDTQMAISVYRILEKFGEINQDALIADFYALHEPKREYGAGITSFFGDIANINNWRIASQNQFDGKGSYGNGAAMRIAPLGAYFFDDIPLLIEQVVLSAEVTHKHPEAIVGAVAVALAAAHATELKVKASYRGRKYFLESIIPYIPESQTKNGIIKALEIAENISIWTDVVRILGNGSATSAQDTVPFSLYCAAEYLYDFETAVWHTISGRGDIDTNCAIVGGIAACYSNTAFPEKWIERAEKIKI